MSALGTALRPALTPALGSARRGVSRYFTTFDKVAQSYAQLDNVVSLAGDFTIEFYYAGADGGAHFIGEPTAGTSRTFLFSGNWYIEGLGVNLGPSATITNGNLNKLKIVRESGVITGYVNGVENGSGNSNTGYSFTRIGGYFENDFTQGIISGVKISDNGTTVLDMPINRYYTPQNNIVLDESGNGNNGTFVNVAAGDSKYYQQRADGNFVDLQGNVLEVAY